jgi:hypothetical protein
MRKTFLSLSLGLISIVGVSSATVITVGGTSVANQGLQTSVAGATTIDFNVGNGVNPTYVEDGFTYSGLSAGSIRNNSVGSCAQPPNDTSNYLCVGPTQNSPVTATYGSLLNYFGFYVGSVDTYNFLDFYDGNTLKFSLTGSQIATRSGIAANGNQGIGVYINIYANAGEEFNKIVFTSTSNALETDNHAFGKVNTIPTVDGQVPEPGTLLTIIPAAAFLYFRRKRA